VTSLQIVAIVVLALPALAFILWPIFKKGGDTAAGILALPNNRYDELAEEKRALYRALRELEFDHQAGHLSEDDYAELRNRYEARAARVLKALDLLDAARPKAELRETAPAASAVGQPRAWTTNPVTLAIGAVVLLIFGLALGLGVARYTEPDRTTVPPGSRLPVPLDTPGMGGGQAGGREPGNPPLGVGREPGSPPLGGPIHPEMLRGMLEAARQSLFAGRYQEAIAAYQAVLKREPKNVDALTHLGLIVAIGGHSDTALESFGKALALDPNYAPAYLYRGQILYEVKQDYRGAIDAWERYLALVPQGEDHARVTRLVQEAKGRLLNSPR
jgi:tetratricopeptide (TPR) repeat protein